MYSSVCRTVSLSPAPVTDSVALHRAVVGGAALSLLSSTVDASPAAATIWTVYEQSTNRDVEGANVVSRTRAGVVGGSGRWRLAVQVIADGTSDSPDGRDRAGGQLSARIYACSRSRSSSRAMISA